jgi:formylglycine-generating enzyme required for sulfatase activity
MLLAGALIAFGASSVRSEPPKPGEVREFEIAAGAKMKFCWVPAGQVQLGAPEHEVDYVIGRYFAGVRPGWMDAESAGKCGKFATKGFWLGKVAVTQAEWRAVMGNNPSWFAKDAGGAQKVAALDTGRFPVEQVSWSECAAFLKKLNDRGGAEKAFGNGRFVLPHENEWEYACRGGKGNATAFHFGSALDGKQANATHTGIARMACALPTTNAIARPLRACRGR